VWHVDDIVRAVKGMPLIIGKETFSGVSTDSRTIEKGELFVPLTGKNFDGHAFIKEAYKRSRAGFLCEKDRRDVLQGAEGTIILVDDTMEALFDLARYKRERLRSTVIAITGSNGKTTTKEILANIMKRGFSLHYNERNYNNVIGVSQSILAIEGDPEFCIFELGTNNKGEIGELARLTEPDASLITNINPSHLEGLFDLEGVLEEKLSLFYGTKEGGKVIINADDPYILPRFKNDGYLPTTYAIANKADLTLSVEEDLGWEGSRILFKRSGEEFRTKTNLLGMHNLYNVLAASAAASAVGVDFKLIAEGIETFESYGMRFKPARSKKGYTLIDDSYNANPSSMEWAIKTLLQLPCRGKRVVVLGDMKELGEKTAFYHQELGSFLNKSEIPVIALFGDYMRDTFQELKEGKARFFENKKELIDYIAGELEEGDVVLVKGSRAAKMEEIVEALK
jgi:UDP-N-acetylmuramoyl-tripeptide--D-alanyl-D-alanine ligase